MGVIGFTNDGLYPVHSSMADVFRYSWGADAAKVEEFKNKGTGTIGLTTPGAVNVEYGPYLQNLAYNAHNTLAALGQQTYKTGIRFQKKLSLGSDATTGLVRGAYAPKPTLGEYEQIEMPYKLMAKRQAMNLGFTDIGEKNIDDVLTWEPFFAEEGQTWLWSMDNDILRPVDTARPVGLGTAVGGGVDSSAANAGEYVGLESIDRIISNYTEGGFVNGGSATSMKNTPWAQANQIPSTDSAAALAKYRNPAVSGAVADNNFNCYVDQNYTSGKTDGTATLRQLDLSMVDSLILSCMPFWDNNSVEGSCIATGYTTVQHLQTLLQPQQRYQGFVAAQMDVNGVKTVPGQNTGFMVATYNGIPILPDMNMPGGTAADHTAGAQNMYLFNNKTLFQGMLRAPTVEISENSIMTGQYVRLCDMYQISEVQVRGKYKGLGKVLHLA